MNDKKLQEDFDQYKRSYKQIVGRNEQLELQYEKQEAKIGTLTAALGHCQQALDLNKMLMRQMAEENNHKEAELVAFMNLLKDKLREYGYGDFNNLGHEGN